MDTVSAARNSDVVVAAMGEAANMSGESGSRTDISLPECQKKLLKALTGTGKPVVLVLFSGRPMTLAWENEAMTSILQTWFGGSEAADAITDVLFGDVNPSGKLTMSFPFSVGQIPVYYNMKNTGRDAYSKDYRRYASNWIDCPNEPLYPFGYGLSYTPLFVVSYYFLQRNLFSSMNQYLNTKFTKPLLILFKYLLLNLYAIMIKCYVSLLKMEVFI